MGRTTDQKPKVASLDAILGHVIINSMLKRSTFVVYFRALYACVVCIAARVFVSVGACMVCNQFILSECRPHCWSGLVTKPHKATTTAHQMSRRDCRLMITVKVRFPRPY